MTPTDPSLDWQPQYFNDYQSEPYRLGEVTAARISGISKEGLNPEVVVIAKIGAWYLTALPSEPESTRIFDQILSSFKLIE